MKLESELLFKKSPKRYMFEHKWTLQEDFNEIMTQWQLGDNMDDLPRKLSQFGGILKEWAGYRFSSIPRRIESLHKELNQFLTPNHAASNANKIFELEHTIEKLVSQEELHWKQKARTNWLAHGDGHTKFSPICIGAKKI